MQRGFQTTNQWLGEARREFDALPEGTLPYELPYEGTYSAVTFYRNLGQSIKALLFFEHVRLSHKNPNNNIDEKTVDDFLEAYGPVLEMVFSRIVDSVSLYISSILRDCLQSRTEVLRSKETVTLEFALSFESMDDLQDALTKRKVDELAYLGFPKLVDWISDRLGIVSLSSLPAYQLLAECIEIRNCIVHNNSEVSTKYLRIAPAGHSLVLNDPIMLDFQMIYLTIRSASEFVSFLDEQLTIKFAQDIVPLAQPTDD